MSTTGECTLLENNKQCSIDRIEAVRYEGKVVNFGDNKVDITCIVEDKSYAIEDVQLPIKRDKRSIFYECPYILNAANRRKAFRTRATYDAVLTNKLSHVAVDASIYDISTSGIGLLVDEQISIEQGTPVGVGIYVDKNPKNMKPVYMRVTGEVARCSSSEYTGKNIVGIKLEEKGKPASYDKLVFEEQLRYRNGRNNIK